MRKAALLHGLLYFTVTIVLVYFMIPEFEAATDPNECPGTIGMQGADLQVHYFYTDYCLYCMFEKPIIRKMVEDHDVEVHVYNFDNCRQEAIDYGVNAVPTFIFENEDSTRKVSSFLPKVALRGIICSMGGNCL